MHDIEDLRAELDAFAEKLATALDTAGRAWTASQEAQAALSDLTAEYNRIKRLLAPRPAP